MWQIHFNISTLDSFLYGKLKKIGHLQLTQIDPLLIHVSAKKQTKKNPLRPFLTPQAAALNAA